MVHLFHAVGGRHCVRGETDQIRPAPCIIHISQQHTNMIEPGLYAGGELDGCMRRYLIVSPIGNSYIKATRVLFDSSLLLWLGGSVYWRKDN